MDLWTFDFEVFKYDWTCVFKKYGTNEHLCIVNNAEALMKFYQEHRNDILVGFNIKHYDMYIFKAILSGLDPYEVSKAIIEDKTPGWRIKGIKRFPFIIFDLSQDIQGKPFLSLKEIEGNLGQSIIESTIDFKIDRKLTEDELEEVLDYNCADVDATEAVFEARYEHFQGAVRLIQQFDLGIQNLDRTTAQLTAMVLEARKPKSRYDEMIYDRPEEVQVSDPRILGLYTSPIDYKKKLDVMIAGIPHRLAYGGLHGAAKDPVFIDEPMVLLDVVQYYPSMMNRFNFLSRNTRRPGKFKEITDARIEYKATKHVMDYPFKIMIAATYGAMKNRYNGLYDPKMPNQVCITGQLLLIDLLEKLEPYITHVQSNTDGLLVIPKHLPKVREIVSEWENRTGMDMEWDWGERLWQKDVNNYIYEHADGSLTVKGGYVKQYYGKDTWMNNSLRIVDRAVVDYAVHGIMPEQTIFEEKRLIEFQRIVKGGATYTSCEHDVDGVMVEVNKVNRIFASQDKSFGKLYRIKKDAKHAMPGVPDSCIIINEDIRGLSTLDVPIDKSWYVQMAWDRIEDFGMRRPHND